MQVRLRRVQNVSASIVAALSGTLAVHWWTQRGAPEAYAHEHRNGLALSLVLLLLSAGHFAPRPWIRVGLAVVAIAVMALGMRF